jgi:hypothetical protein
MLSVAEILRTRDLLGATNIMLERLDRLRPVLKRSWGRTLLYLSSEARKSIDAQTAYV